MNPITERVIKELIDQPEFYTKKKGHEVFLLNKFRGACGAQRNLHWLRELYFPRYFAMISFLRSLGEDEDLFQHYEFEPGLEGLIVSYDEDYEFAEFVQDMLEDYFEWLWWEHDWSLSDFTEQDAIQFRSPLGQQLTFGISEG